jgi:hypothetical protein
MAFLNLNLSRTAYNDISPTTKPQMKVFDTVNVAESTLVSFPSSCSKVIQPGQVDNLGSTSRTLNYDGTSQFVISQPYGNDLVRFRWTGTGTAPSFRTLRSIGHDATTTVNVGRVNTGTMRIDFVAGTLPNLSSASVGDEIYFQPTDDVFTSQFDASYGGNWSVVDKGSDYLLFRDNGSLTVSASNVVLGADFATAIRVYSTTGVQVGDSVAFSSFANMTLDNRGTFSLLGVTDRDLLFINPYVIAETVIPGADSFVAYSRLLNFLSIWTNGKLKIKFNPNDSYLTMQEYKQGECLLIMTASVHTIYTYNDTTMPIAVQIESASF